MFFLITEEQVLTFPRSWEAWSRCGSQLGASARSTSQEKATNVWWAGTWKRPSRDSGAPQLGWCTSLVWSRKQSLGPKSGLPRYTDYAPNDDTCLRYSKYLGAVSQVNKHRLFPSCPFVSRLHDHSLKDLRWWPRPRGVAGTDHKHRPKTRPWPVELPIYKD